MILTNAKPLATAIATNIMSKNLINPTALVNLAGTAAPLASMLLFAAPIPTIRQVTQDKDSGSLPLLPYTCTIASCFVWSMYGVLVKEESIWATNAIGVVTGLFYFIQFARFAPKQSSTLPGSISQHIQGILAIMLLTCAAAIALPPKAVGMMGVMLTIALFSSPLAALKTVLQTKSAASIPLPFTLASIANCFLWSVVGLFSMKDFNVVFPNSLGLLSGLVQVFLKILYRNGGKELEMAM
jgi:solute carrier family 50 protein (sugar transporter)